MNAAMQISEMTGPVRTCAGCRAKDAQDALVRLRALELAAGSKVPHAGGAGRGVYVHPRMSCLRAFATGGAARSLRQRVSIELEDLRAALAAQLNKKVKSLLSSARTTRACSVGEAAVRAQLSDRIGEVGCLVFANDAAGRRSAFEHTAMLAEIPVYAWADKAVLGECWQRTSLGVVAICDKKIANEVGRALRALAELAEGA